MRFVNEKRGHETPRMGVPMRVRIWAGNDKACCRQMEGSRVVRLNQTKPSFAAGLCCVTCSMPLISLRFLCVCVWYVRRGEWRVRARPNNKCLMGRIGRERGLFRPSRFETTIDWKRAVE